MLLWAVLYATVAVSITVAVPDYSGDTYDICQKKYLHLDRVGKSGNITFDNTSMDHSHDYTCVLHIESCSSCQIELKPASQDNFEFYCPSGEVTPRYCSLGCDYLYILDKYYVNETIKVYRSWQQFNTKFISESSDVTILLCHGYSKNYRFKLEYNTIRKLSKIQGLSNTGMSTGYISSPYFPNGYAQNHEVYEYQLNSTNPGDYIQLMFEDWHLAETSVFYFENSNIHSQISGRSQRPVVVSNKNYLRFTFNTGIPEILRHAVARDYLGFRVAYKFYNNRADIPQPQTYCKSDSYHMSSVGGKIEFTASSPSRDRYDCIWVLKKNDRFQGIYMKIVKFQSNGHFLDTAYDDNMLYIRDGLTSTGTVFEVVNMKHLQDSNDGVIHFSDKGFYLRLTATLSFSTTLIISYASYSNSPGCDNMLYICDNRRCIDQSLVCDGIDHCGDNSDEVAGCDDNNAHWDKSYQYTITIGVIVPMVISVFLIMVICLLFVMIRRCRRAQMNELAESNERLRTVSEEVSNQHGVRRRRRRRRGLFSQAERDRPPTYDEAMQNPPGWYQNVAFGNPVDPSLPRPPSYNEAIGGQTADLPSTTNQSTVPGSPVSTNSSQSEITMCSGNISDTSTSTSDDDDDINDVERWGQYRGDREGRRGRLGRHISSSESDTFTTVDQSRLSVSSPEHCEPVNSASVLTTHNEDNINSPDMELRNVNSENRAGRGSKLKDRNILKIPTSESDDFVVPAGPKPGGSDIAGPVHSCSTEVKLSSSDLTGAKPSRSDRATSNNQPDIIRTYDSQKPSVPKPAPRKSLDHRRSQPPECDTDRHNTPLNRTKPKISNNSAAINPAYNRSEDSADSYYDTCTSGVTNTESLSEYHNTRDDRVTQPLSASRQSLDDNLQSRTVVNVDDDDIMIMYDSQSSLYGASMTPPRYLLSQVQHRSDDRSRPYRTREGQTPIPSDNNVPSRSNYNRGKSPSDKTGEVVAPSSKSRSNESSGRREKFTPSSDNISAKTDYSRGKPAPNSERERVSGKRHENPGTTAGDIDVIARNNRSRGKTPPSNDRQIPATRDVRHDISATSDSNISARTRGSGLNDGIHIDETIMSAEDYSEPSYTPRSMRGYAGSEQTLHLSMNNLDDLEDVYV